MAKESDEKPNALFALSRPSRCYGCDSKLVVGDIAKLNKKNEDEKEVFCLSCAGLSGMELLPSGNAAVTRLAKKYSTKHFVVMRWSEVWKTYERQGLLVEVEALKQARDELQKK